MWLSLKKSVGPPRTKAHGGFWDTIGYILAFSSCVEEILVVKQTGYLEDHNINV